MRDERPEEIGPAIEVLKWHVGAGVAQIQQAAAVAFAAVDPEKAHQEADRLAKALRAEQLLQELVGVLEDLGLEAGNGVEAPARTGQGPVTHGGSRLPDGPALYQKVLTEPVLDALRHHGGTASLNQIWDFVEGALRDRFSKSDLDSAKNHPNEPRWRYNVRWTLTNLKNAGKVEHAGRRGIWRLTR